MAQDKTTLDLLTQQRAEAPEFVESDNNPDDEAVLSNELYSKFQGTSQTWRDEMIEDWDFFLGAQISSKQNETNQKRKQKSYTVDVIFQAVEQAIALLTSNHPRFTATGTEDSDTRVAAVFALIMQFVWYINNGVQKLKQSIKDYYVGSIGWILVSWDPLMSNGRGDIRIDSIDPQRVYVDDTTKGFFFADAGHMMIESYLSSEMMQAELNIPLEELGKFETSSEELQSSTRMSEMNSGSGSRSSSGTPVYRRLDRYSRVKELAVVLRKDNERFEMKLPPEGLSERLHQMTVLMSRRKDITTWFVHPRNVANLSQLFQQYGGVFHEVVDANGQQSLMSGIENQIEYPAGTTPIPDSTTFLKYATMYDALRKGEVEMQKIFDDKIKHVASIGNKVLLITHCPTGHYPLIPLINNFDRTPFPVGDVRRVKREQEFINSIRQLVITHAAITTNFKIGYPDGRFSEEDLSKRYNDPSQRFIPYDAEMQSSGLQVIAPPPLANHLYALEQQARKNIEERLGIFSLMQGSPTDAPSTYKGTVALDEYGQRRIKSKKDDIEEFLNQIGKVVVDYVQYYYKDSRVISLTEPNDKPKTVVLRNDFRYDSLYEGNEYRINDLTVGRWDIMVISGSTLPSNRFALLELYSELFKIGLLDQETVLKKTEIANVEEVMQRIGLINQLKSALEQAQGQIKQLSGDMQTKDRELMHSKREAEMAMFKRDLDVEEVKATAARMIYEKELKGKLRLLPGSPK